MQKTFIKPAALTFVLLLSSAVTPFNSFADGVKADSTNISNQTIGGSEAEPKLITCRVIDTGDNITYCSVEDESCRAIIAYTYLETTREQCHALGGEIVGL